MCPGWPRCQKFSHEGPARGPPGPGVRTAIPLAAPGSSALIMKTSPTLSLVAAALLLLLPSACEAKLETDNEPASPTRNLLVIIADDWRPAANHSFGMTEISTPHIDALSRSGLTFLNAYSQFQWCSPSRNSFMSGRRPGTIHVYNGINSFRDPGACVKTSGKGCTSWPEHFKNSGFVTAGVGKTFHNGSPKNWDQPLSWSVPYFDANTPGVNIGCDKPPACTSKPQPCLGAGHAGRFFCPSDPTLRQCDKPNHHPTTCPKCITPGRGAPGTDPGFGAGNQSTGACPGTPDEPDTSFIDGKFRDHAVSLLQQSANDSRPFAFFVGFRRPHMPWRMPWRFWQAYNRSGHELSIAAPAAQTIGENVSTLAYAQNGFASGHNSWDSATWGPQQPLPEGLQRHIRRSYYSAVSWMDDCVGNVLAALDASGKADDTAVLLFADHGWKLGEHSGYSKTCAWETDTRVPLIVRVPWAPASLRGERSNALVELVDFFPSTSELLGLALPPDETLDGSSFASIFTTSPAWIKAASFSQHPRCWACKREAEGDMRPACTALPVVGTPWVEAGDWECLGNAKKNETRATITAMGMTMRTHAWRYTEWRLWQGDKLAADWSESALLAVEMYDHRKNTGVGPSAFDEFEFQNLGYVAAHVPERATLAAALKAQFASAASNDPGAILL